MEEHEEDEDEPVEEGSAVLTPPLTRQERAFVTEPAKVPAAVKAVAGKTAVKQMEAEDEEEVVVRSSTKAVSAVALTALVATAAHLATGRKGPGKGTFAVAERLAAQTAGRFASPAPRGGGGGGFHFQVQDFKENLLKRKVTRSQQGPGQAPASGGF